jgi:ribosomal protein L9
MEPTLESEDKSFIPSRKRFILWSMNEKEIQARFEDIQNELEAQRAQLAAFKEDLKILLRHRSIACRDIVETAQQQGNSAFDQSDVQECKEFLKKYGVRKGF